MWQARGRVELINRKWPLVTASFYLCCYGGRSKHFSRRASTRSYLCDPDELSWSFVGASPGFVSENLRLSAVVVTC